MTGAVLPIVGAPSEDEVNQIYVGQSEWADKLGVSTEDLTDGASRMVSGPDCLVLLGADKDFQPKEPWAHSRKDQARVLAEWDEITGEHLGNICIPMYRKLDPESGLWQLRLGTNQGNDLMGFGPNPGVGHGINPSFLCRAWKGLKT